MTELFFLLIYFFLSCYNFVMYSLSCIFRAKCFFTLFLQIEILHFHKCVELEHKSHLSKQLSFCSLCNHMPNCLLHLAFPITVPLYFVKIQLCPTSVDSGRFVGFHETNPIGSFVQDCHKSTKLGNMRIIIKEVIKFLPLFMPITLKFWLKKNNHLSKELQAFHEGTLLFF